MTSLKIVQSMTVLNVLNLNTLRSAVVDGAEVFQDDLNDVTISAADLALSEVLVVLPIHPACGDKVVSLLEGEIVTGTIYAVLECGWAVAFPGFGTVALDRNQFHVIEAGSNMSHDNLTLNDELVVVSEGDANFPYGTRAKVTNIGKILIAKNNLDWAWDATSVSFRLLDKTVIDFVFEDEVEPILTTDAGTITDKLIKENEDDMTAAINETLDKAFGIDAPATEVTVTQLPEDLQHANIAIKLTDENGNPISWDDLPEDAQATVRAAFGEVSSALGAGTVDTDDDAPTGSSEIEVDAAAPGINAEVATNFFTDLLGAMFGGDQVMLEAQRQAAEMDRQLSELAVVSVRATEEHKTFMADAVEEIEGFNAEIMRNIAVAQNLLGRLITLRGPADRALAESLLQINALLSAARDDAFNVDKMLLAANVDIEIDDALQANVKERVVSLATH